MSELFARHEGANVVEPWGYPADAGECDGDRAVLGCLRKRWYGRAFEAGCGAGALTELLAASCRRLIASDLAPSLVARARVRCGHLDHVSVRCADLSDYLPDGPLDLVILRDVAHPMSAAELLRIGLELCERLAPGGQLIALHGARKRLGNRMDSESIHNLLSANIPLGWTSGASADAYRLDTWAKL